MKALILIIIVTSSSIFAESKVITFDDYVISMQLKADQNYRLTLQEHAAQYIAKTEHVKCLQDGMKMKKKLKLTVDPYSLNILSCVLPKK